MNRKLGLSVPERTTGRTLRGLLEVASLARSRGALPERLGELAATIGSSLGYGTVAIALYRPAFDDFGVVAVGGGEDARRALLGRTRTWDDYRARPEAPASGDRAADLVLRASSGEPLGVLSVDGAAWPRPPEDAEPDVLAAVAEHVALAIEGAQAHETAARHRASLAHLLQVSSQLHETLSVDDILQSVSDAISRALGFERVSIELAHARDGAFVPRASTGWGAAGPPSSGLGTRTIAPLLDPAYEIEGCYLLPLDVASPRVVLRHEYASSLNGTGPGAWNRHWLLVPLADRAGALQGFIWPDDPADRLLPSRESLQALRLFANQATMALESAARFAELRFLADHDPLTRLPNRRAFVRQLEAETARSRRYGHPFSLVLCDLDEFKQLNDREGHLVGDDELTRFATRLIAAMRRTDFAFRIGGDEFALILVESTDEHARLAIDRIARSVRGGDAALRASFGVAVYEPEETSDELFRRADQAMYEAKRSGGSVAVAA
jgi:diguanylate cyclase (GGDEF)-like protein